VVALFFTSYLQKGIVVEKTCCEKEG